MLVRSSKSLFTCCLLFAILIQQSNAQLFVSDNVIVTNNGASIEINGDVVLQNSAQFNNFGSIDVSGNWTNNSGLSGFVSPSGIVSFFGPGTKIIGGTSQTNFFHVNLASGSGDVSLAQNMSTGGFGANTLGNLDINNVHLRLNNFTLKIANKNPLAIARTSGLIISENDPIAGYGTIEWEIGNTPPPVNYVFPFGTDVSFQFIPVSLTLSSAGLGSSGKIAVSTYPTNVFLNPNNRPLPTGVSLLTNGAGIDNSDKVLDRFWIINSSSYGINPTSAITFTYLDAEHNSGNNSIVELNLQMQRTGGATWSFPAIGSVNVAANTVSVAGVNTYNFAWVAVDNSAPLPVTLLDFNAEAINEKEVLCKWTTASEINSSHFEVERSFDGLKFEFIGSVKAAGNSSQVLHYSLLDPSPQVGINYYRLKQFDMDGTFKYSAVVSVRFNPNAVYQVNIYPNPSSEFVYISVNGIINHQNTLLRLYDITGRLLMSKPLHELKTNSDQLFTLSVAHLAPAAYVLEIEGTEGKTTSRLIINR